MADNLTVLRIYRTLILEGMPESAPEIIADIVEEAKVSEKEAYAALISALCGFDSEENEDEMRIEREYFSKIEMLSPEKYRDDPYYKNIVFPRVEGKRWSLGSETYKPYEPFVWRDIELCEDFREIPQLGFFKDEFSFPAVFEGGVEWMAIKPNEIETMRAPLDAVSGDVLTYGLGLGYFTYMASEKTDVKSITVVERDAEIIKLFKEHILPQFANKDKVRIVHADALEYGASRIQNEHFDYVFADLWHDASDGFDLYIKLKRLEKNNTGAKYLYWIEDTIISNLRQMVYEALAKKNTPEGEIKKCLEDEYLKKLAYDIKRE